MQQGFSAAYLITKLLAWLLTSRSSRLLKTCCNPSEAIAQDRGGLTLQVLTWILLILSKLWGVACVDSDSVGDDPSETWGLRSLTKYKPDPGLPSPDPPSTCLKPTISAVSANWRLIKTPPFNVSFVWQTPGQGYWLPKIRLNWNQTPVSLVSPVMDRSQPDPHLMSLHPTAAVLKLTKVQARCKLLLSQTVLGSQGVKDW